MMKKLALAAALAFAAGGIATTANAGHFHGHKHFHGHFHGYKHFKHHYHGYHHHKPVYIYKYYKPVCHHYDWVWKHGHKVWACVG